MNGLTRGGAHTHNGALLSLKKETVTHATTRMDLENMLSEMHLSQQNKYCMIPPIRAG